MNDTLSLEQRVDRLESRFAIRELVSRYAIACDEHDLDELSSLFAEDAEFDSPSGIMRCSGRDGITKMFTEVLSIRGPSYHWTHDHLVRADPDDADRATGTVYSHAETSPNGTASIAAMKYDDVYVRRDGEWLFGRRNIQFLYYVPFSEYGSALTREKRVRVGDTWLEADFPEKLAAWQDFDRRFKR